MCDSECGGSEGGDSEGGDSTNILFVICATAVDISLSISAVESTAVSFTSKYVIHKAN